MRAPGAGKLMPAPYVNLVFVNGGVLLPPTRRGGRGPRRTGSSATCCRVARSVGLPVEMSAFGGGGLGCITQQVPGWGVHLLTSVVPAVRDTRAARAEGEEGGSRWHVK